MSRIYLVVVQLRVGHEGVGENLRTSGDFYVPKIDTVWEEVWMDVRTLYVLSTTPSVKVKETVEEP